MRPISYQTYREKEKKGRLPPIPLEDVSLFWKGDFLCDTDMLSRFPFIDAEILMCQLLLRSIWYCQANSISFTEFGSTTEFVPFTSNYNFGLNFPSIHLTQSKQRAIYYTQIILICTLLLEGRGWFWMYLRVLYTNNFDVYFFIGTKTQGEFKPPSPHPPQFLIPH